MVKEIIHYIFVSTVKYFLNIIFLLTIISGVITYYITTSFDPDQTSNQIFYYLYLAVTTFLTGILTLAIYWLKVRIINKNIINQYLTTSLRQAFLISTAFVILLILQTLDVLSYWDAIPIVLAFFFLELFFQSEKISKTI